MNSASLGLMAGTLIELGYAHLNSAFSLALALASLGLLLRLRLNTTWLILGARWPGGCGAGCNRTTPVNQLFTKR